MTTSAEEREMAKREAERWGITSPVTMMGRCSRGCVLVTDGTLLRSAYAVLTSNGHYRLERQSRITPPDATCDHGRMSWQRVNGRQSTTKCGPRCWNARRPDCECECVGRNHGRDHAA